MSELVCTTLRTLAAATDLPVAPHIAARIGAFAEGDEQVVAELAGVLTPAQLRGGSALPDPLPMTPAAHAGELAGLRASERRMLQFAALSDTGLVVDLLDAAAVEPDVLLFGELRRLLSASGGRVSFCSDRVRAQVTADIDPGTRRHTHEALARAGKRRHDHEAALWHRAHADALRGERAVRALLASADNRLARGDLSGARTLALLVAGGARGEFVGRAWATAGLAAFWAGDVDDALLWLERAQEHGDPGLAAEVEAALFVCRALTRSEGVLPPWPAVERIYGSLVRAARDPADRAALTQVAAIMTAVFDRRPEEADARQARLFLSVDRGAAASNGGLSPHAEAHVVLLQVAFQSQSGDRTGAARVLRDAVPRLPLALPASGIVSSFLRILREHDLTFNDTLIAAFDAVGPARPLRYDGDGASLGHGPDIGRLAAAAVRLVSAAVPKPQPVSAVPKPQPVSAAPHAPPEPEVALSARQQDVLSLIAEGRSNREIAGALSISHRTVEVHIGQILRKYGVRDRAQLLSLLAGRGRAASSAPAAEG